MRGGDQIHVVRYCQSDRAARQPGLWRRVPWRSEGVVLVPLAGVPARWGVAGNASAPEAPAVAPEAYGLGSACGARSEMARTSVGVSVRLARVNAGSGARGVWEHTIFYLELCASLTVFLSGQRSSPFSSLCAQCVARQRLRCFSTSSSRYQPRIRCGLTSSVFSSMCTETWPSSVPGQITMSGAKLVLRTSSTESRSPAISSRARSCCHLRVRCRDASGGGRRLFQKGTTTPRSSSSVLLLKIHHRPTRCHWNSIRKTGGVCLREKRVWNMGVCIPGHSLASGVETPVRAGASGRQTRSPTRSCKQRSGYESCRSHYRATPWK